MKTLLFFIIISYVLNSPKSFANFAEFFGAGPESISLGNQGTDDPNNPVNNYYAPSFLAWNKHISFAFSSSAIRHNFEDIKNIIIKNDSNSRSGTEIGNANNSYGDFYNGIFHLVLPVFRPINGVIGVSLFAPIGYIAEVDSGDPILPEYIMYRARNKRSLVFFNYARAINNSFSFSLGATIGFEVNASMTTQAALNGSTIGSSSSLQAKIAPNVSPMFSFSYINNNLNLFLSYIHEVKSELNTDVIGETSDPPIPFDINASSMTYFDPNIVRLAGNYSFSLIKLYTTLEYQIWKNFKTSIIRLVQRASIKSSDDYENVQVKNILIPRFGIKYLLNNYWEINGGISYRATPVQNDFSGAGNSLDADTIIFTLGTNYLTKILDKSIKMSIGTQYHQLKDKFVIKTSGQENGDSGSKIGGPSYKIGGNVLLLNIGAKVSF